MTTKRDYYEILGASKNASPDELKAAYRKMALKYHPDRNQGNKEAEEKFKEVNEAFEVLSNQEKRSLYDQFGHAGVQQGAGAGAGGFGDFGGFGDAFSDFFGDIFGGGSSRRRRPRRGADLQYELGISLEEAFSGTQSKIKVTRRVMCEKCHGSGAKSGTSSQTCSDCRGSGQVRLTRGFFTMAQTCPRCQGEGQVVAHPCADCHGQGRVKATESINVRIPAGVDDGMSLRVAGAGEAGERGVSPGDLYVIVRVREDARFQREDENLICSRHISVSLASLGGEIEVPTLEKSVRIHIPAGTQSGTIFRVKGSGMPRLRGSGKGDLFVKVIVDIPTKLTKDQKRLLVELAQSMGESHLDADEGLFKKVFGK